MNKRWRYLTRLWEWLERGGKRKPAVPRRVLASRSKLTLNEAETDFCIAIGRDSLSMVNAAMLAGISPGAAYRWLKKPKIREAIGRITKDCLAIESAYRIQLAEEPPTGPYSEEPEIQGEPV